MHSERRLTLILRGHYGDDMGASDYAAIVLAGGRATRFGGVHKPGLIVGGRTLLDRVLSAVSDASPRIVVGPDQPLPYGVQATREDPPGGGPVAALGAGLSLVPSIVDWVAVLAADLPFLASAEVLALRTAAVVDGAVLVDDQGRDQYLAGVWRVSSLVAALPDPPGGSMRHLLSTLDYARVARAVEPAPWFDCDDPEDLRRAERWSTDHE